MILSKKTLKEIKQKLPKGAVKKVAAEKEVTTAWVYALLRGDYVDAKGIIERLAELIKENETTQLQKVKRIHRLIA